MVVDHITLCMACQAAIILSEEETKLTCICVVANKQIFKINYFQNVVPRVPIKRSRQRCFTLWPVLQQNAFAAERRVTDKQTDRTK
jgi:hypothetical protein